MFFISWIHFFCAAKEIDLNEEFFVIDSKGAKVSITYKVIVEAICFSSMNEQDLVKNKLIELSDNNYQIKPFFEHLAKVIAK